KIRMIACFGSAFWATCRGSAQVVATNSAAACRLATASPQAAQKCNRKDCRQCCDESMRQQHSPLPFGRFDCCCKIKIAPSEVVAESKPEHIRRRWRVFELVAMNAHATARLSPQRKAVMLRHGRRQMTAS